MTARGRAVLALAAVVATAAAVAPAQAQDLLSKIEVHGYGGWSFGRTMDNVSSNFFLFAHARGDYFHNEFALNLTAPLTDRVTIIAQPFWHCSSVVFGSTQANGETATALPQRHRGQRELQPRANAPRRRSNRPETWVQWLRLRPLPVL